MIKIFGMLAMLILLVMPTFSQEISANQKEESLYYEALKTYLEKNEQEYSKLFPERDFHNVIVAKNSLITKNLPNKIGVYSINFVNYDELVEVAKKNATKDSEAKITIVEIHPIKNEKNKLVIKLVKSNARYEKKQVSLGVSDSVEIFFAFDCSKQAYIVDKVEFYGI